MKKIFITDIDIEGAVKFSPLYTPQDIYKHLAGKIVVSHIKNNEAKQFLNDLSKVCNFEFSKLNFGDQITNKYYLERKGEKDFNIYLYTELRSKVVYE